MKTATILILIFCIHHSVSQNLVPNGSFETFINCPSGNSQLVGNVPPWQNPPGSGTTPDYFNACAAGIGTSCANIDVPSNFAGYATAFDGTGYAGVFSVYSGCPNCREYFQAPLTQPLTANQAYNISMRIRLGSESKYASDKMGMAITTTAISQPGNQPINNVVPQLLASTVINDTANWTLLSTQYVAIGGEQFVTIGCFFDNTSLNIDTFASSNSQCALANSAAFYYFDSIIIAPISQGVLPVAALSSSDTVWCDKTCIDFFDLSQNNPTSWTWYFQGALPATSTIQNPTAICYNNYGSFDVALVACNGNGCDSLFFNDFITEFPLPAIPTVNYINDTLWCSTAAQYQWYNINNITQVLSIDSFFVPTQSGNYFVLISDTNGCQVPSNVVPITVSIYDINDQPFHVWQIDHQFFVSLGSFTQNVRVELLDTKGSILMTTQSALTQTMTLDISELAFGPYFIKIITKDKIHIKRMLKH